MKSPLTTERGYEMENFIVKYHSVLFSIIVAVFLLASTVMALAKEGVITAQGVCEYKKTHYECFVLKIDEDYHIILEKGGKIIAIYKIVKTNNGVETVLSYEYGEEI